mmetsp:Transcript_61551/g.156374  ORF Transcript_61551/g.156374 Transcript_61551/m.156374 type:complete len:200 (+) Transcript_61551:705-1304(+)
MRRCGLLRCAQGGLRTLRLEEERSLLPSRTGEARGGLGGRGGEGGGAREGSCRRPARRRQRLRRQHQRQGRGGNGGRRGQDGGRLQELLEGRARAHVLHLRGKLFEVSVEPLPALLVEARHAQAVSEPEAALARQRAPLELKPPIELPFKVDEVRVPLVHIPACTPGDGLNLIPQDVVVPGLANDLNLQRHAADGLLKS